MKLPPLASEDLRQHVRQNYLSALSKAHHELGDVFRVAIGKHELYFVAHPDLAREVLLQKDSFVKLGSSGPLTGLQLVLGEGLLTVTNPELWRKSRRLLQPMFHQKMVMQWKDKIVKASQKLLERLQEKTEVDIAQEMLDTTAEILYDIIFSLSEHEIPKYPITVPLSLATAKRKTLREAMLKLEPVLLSLVNQRKAQRGRYQDILGLLLETQAEDPTLTDKQLCDELLTLFAAGHETTSYALAWAFYLLSQNPESYKRLLDEVKHTPDLQPSPYATAVFKESLRLYPTIPSAPRVTLQQTRLGEFDIPQGARVFVSLYLIHRHKHYWKQADSFCPERFLSNEPEAYMPFGLGKRYCLGKNLAMLQGPLLLSEVSNYLRLELSPASIVSSKVAISLAPRYGIKMKVKPLKETLS
jgi:cytochrome P450